MKQWLLVFDSTHHAIAAEHRIKEGGFGNLTIEMIPTPRQITASCGLSLRLTGNPALQPQALLQWLVRHQVQWAGLYWQAAPEAAPWKLFQPAETKEDKE